MVEQAAPTAIRRDQQYISNWIDQRARVLDLGCGDGLLLAHLMAKKAVRGYGLEIDIDKVNAAIARGVSVIHADLEVGLEDFEDESFDTVIVSHTLQTVRNTERLVNEITRVGKEAIVSFPNFGYWQVRGYLYFRGQMPVSKKLPYQWYNTPNIHLFTVRDFYRLCKDHDIEILDRYFQTAKWQNTFWQKAQPNLWAELAAFRVKPRTKM